MINQTHQTPPDVPGFDLVRLIGLGGMGEVYLANQQALNRPVAIKFLARPASDGSDEYELRFRREAELMARVSHPNVVTIFDFGTAEGRPYLVMEYVEAGDLRSRMVPDSPMGPGEILAVIVPVIRALEYLHRQGIIHRDLKPENILIHHEETPKVTDFGLAVLDDSAGSLTRTGRMMGTLGYVSPEQQYGLKVDERTDQFSTAAMCYELATGRKPLGNYPPPSRLNPRLGPEADAAIRRGLSEDPDDRFPTIGEFGDALDRGLRASTRPRGHRRLVRAAALAALVAAGVGLELASGFSRGWFGPKAPPPRIVAKAAGIPMVLVPAGEFWMGSPESDHDARGEERPRHHVRISRPFYLGATEVTVGQFRAFVKAKGYRTTAEASGKGGWMYSIQANQIEQWTALTWEHPGMGRAQAEDEPVLQVSWDDAMAFCGWLSEAEGRLYRLPTEAEWEYACRGGTTTRWSSGDDPESVNSCAWTIRNSDMTFHRVGTKRPNDFGLFDMHGNAWEWCLDRFSNGYEAVNAVDPSGPLVGRERVLRGGSFDWDRVERTRSASRLAYSPEKCYFNYGFRVCSPAP